MEQGDYVTRFRVLNIGYDRKICFYIIPPIHSFEINHRTCRCCWQQLDGAAAAEKIRAQIEFR